MADSECNIDELTAFLEASDDEDSDDGAGQKEDVSSGKEKSDECSLDEIAAFLEASDDDDEEETNTGSLTVSAGTADGADYEFEEDLDDGDFEQLDLLLSQSQSEQSIESQPSEKEGQSDTLKQCKTKSEAPSSMDDKTEAQSIEAVDWSDDFEDLVVDGESDVNKDQSRTPVNQNTDEEDKTDLAHEAIKAEMAAMAARMEELQRMLEASKSPKASKKTPKDIHKSCNELKKSTANSVNVNQAESKKCVQDNYLSRKSEQNKHTTGLSLATKNSSESGRKKCSTISSETKHRKVVDSVSKQRTNQDHVKRTIGETVKKHSGDVHRGQGTGDSHGRKSSGGVSKQRTNQDHVKPTMGETVKKHSGGVHRGQGTGDSHGRKNSGGVSKRPCSNGTSQHPENKQTNISCDLGKRKTNEEDVKTRKGSSLTPSNDDDTDVNPFFASDAVQADPSQASKIDAHSLFGESDDSDWDELDGDEKTKLSDEGKELKKLITTGVRKRQAHAPSYDPSIIKKPDPIRFTESASKKPKSTLMSRPQPEGPVLDPETGTVSGKYRVKDEYKVQTSQAPVVDERQAVTDPYCGIRIINPRISMDGFKQRMSGRVMMKISRLLSQQGVSDVQKDNWVTLGVVVHKSEPRQSASGKAYCIWKLSDLQACDKTVSFFLFGSVYKEHWKNELGIVVGLLNPTIMDKAEKAQSEMAITINHPQQLLLLGVSKDLGRCRGTTKAGQPCTAPINKQYGEYCMYHVQKAYRSSSSKRTELQTSCGIAPKSFTQKKGSGTGFFFHDGASFSTMRSQGAKPKDKVTLTKLQSLEAQKGTGKITTMSLHELGPEHHQKLQTLQDKDKNLLDMLSVPTAGSMNFVKHLVKNQDTAATDKNSSSTNRSTIESVSAKDLLTKHQTQLKQAKLKQDNLSRVPTLGKGFGANKTISLDLPSSKPSSNASSDAAKLLAIAKVKAKGGLKKEDPNAVRKKLTSPETVEKIRKRAAVDGEEGSGEGDKKSKGPPAKKSKLLGGLDLNSPEVQKLMKSKSKHTGALAEAQAEHEDRYFNALEKKEKMEEKMGSIKEVPVDLVYCIQCQYKFFTLHERCKKENHPTKKMKGVKRFFKCKQCKRRSVSVEKMPTKACKDCGSSSFERVTMLKERTGPKLESEQLSLRGNEQKYVGGLGGTSYLNI